MNAPDAARMSAWRDEVAEAVEVYLDEHASAAVYDETCGTCTAVRRRALTIADALLPLLARIDREAREEERERAKVNDDVRREQIRMARAEGEIARQVRHITAEVDAYARRMLGGSQVEHALLAERADDHAEICDDQEAKP